MTQHITEEELAELERLAAAATPGPWRLGRWSVEDAPGGARFIVDWGGFFPEAKVWVPIVHGDDYYEDDDDEDEDAQVLANSEYIAATSPDTLLRLIGEVRELRRHLSP